MNGPPKLLTFQRPLHFKPAKSASKLRNTLCRWLQKIAVQKLPQGIAIHTLFHVSIKMSSEEILIRFNVSDFSV